MSRKLGNNFMENLCEIIELLSPSMDDYLYVLDFRNDFYYISQQGARRFSMKQNSFHHVMENLKKLVHPDDMEGLRRELDDLVATDRKEHDMVYRWISGEKETVWINCRGKMLRENGEALYLVGCINEVGTRPIADNLSGLLGGSSFREFVNECVSVSPEGYFMRLGIDDLKGINARLGVEYGDMILRKTAECISKHVLPGQRLYRIQGDEYVILDFLGGTVEEAREIYRKIRQSVENFVRENNYEVVFTVSAGVIRCQDAEEFTYLEIMKLTEFALDEAKRQGRNRCYIFREEDYARFLRKRALMLKLRQAVNNDFQGFDAYYQPIFRADSRTLYGAEALMRFHTEEFGSVSPEEFIPILEETGLIIPAGRWILERALRMCSECQKSVPDFHININLSNVQVMKSNIGAELLKAVKEYDVSPSQVTLEMTESRLLESDYRFTNIWSKSKEAGMMLALDDFGTVYSNFRYITELRPNVIKIDRTFTMKALENNFEFELLSLFSKMAHDLKLKICVEGIETEEERETICKLVPDYIQGFYFGRPCPYEDFTEKYLKKKAS